MPEADDLLPRYLDHVRARARSKNRKPTPEDQPLVTLPSEVASFCTRDPSGCLQLIIRALEKADSPGIVEAIGDQLLENLLNEHASEVSPQIEQQLRTDRRFRQAFSFGNYSSVDPGLLDDWVRVFQDLGTTKAAERKKARSQH